MRSSTPTRGLGLVGVAAGVDAPIQCICRRQMRLLSIGGLDLLQYPLRPIHEQVCTGARANTRTGHTGDANGRGLGEFAATSKNKTRSRTMPLDPNGVARILYAHSSHAPHQSTISIALPVMQRLMSRHVSDLEAAAR